MSILIKGMDVPKDCFSCDLANPFVDRPYCRRLMKHVPETGRLKDCPLVEVKTPHGELIDQRKMRERLLRSDLDRFWQGWGVLIEVNEQIPIIEAEEG